MININGQIEKLKAASASLATKAEELSASLLSTNDDAIATLKEKLKQAINDLDKDISELQKYANTANNNKKW